MMKNLRGIFSFGRKYPPQGGFQWGILLFLLFIQLSLFANAKPNGVEADPNILPIAECKDISVVLDSQGKASIMPEDIDNGSYDPDGPFVLFVDIENFTCDDVGAPVDVRLIILDENDAVDICYAKVTVIDDVYPTLDAETLPDITAECQVTMDDLMVPTASDNCYGTIEGVPDVAFPITEQGTKVITWTFTDAGGNIVTQTQNVIIDDVTAPVPDNATLADWTAQCELAVSEVTAPTATDNCVGTVTGTTDATFPIIAQGTTVITWTYDDGNGNTITQTQNVVIADTTAPVPDMESLPDVTAECQVADLTIPSATDNCGGTVTVTNDVNLPIIAQGTTVVTWTYTDQYGNAATQTQNVILEDTTAPVPDAVSLDDFNAQCEVSAADLTVPSATDNCGGTVTVTNDGVFPVTDQGTSVITWTFTDAAGNASTQTQNIVIDDTTAPTPDVESLADITAQCEITSADLTPPTATDNCGGTVTVTNNAVLPISGQGASVITWTYEDVNGNQSTQTQNVIIDDTTPPVPVAETLPDITAQCEVVAGDIAAPAATDNCGGTVTVTSDAAFPITTQGTTVITWTYDDGNGNTSTQTQNVVITDTTAPVPVVSALPDITAQCEVAASDLITPSATDNCSETVTVTNDGTFPLTTQGTTVITWTYTDGAGNSSTQSQNIVITDTTAPVPDAAVLTDITAQCEVTAADLTEPTATDNCAGTVTVSHNATLPISGQGASVITWTFTDAAGNSSTQTQNVIINDTTAPTPDAESLADITAQCEVLATDITAPTATDNCGGTVTVTNDVSFPITDQGTHLITWTFEDANGNSSTQTQNIVIDDTTGPTPDVANLPDITGQCEVIAADVATPAATDNCGGAITVTHDASFPIFASTAITWTYEDQYGNTSTQTQNIIIADTTAPVADVTSLSDITDECEVTEAQVMTPTATDNCGGMVTVTSDATFPITDQGTTVITWSYEDASGNIATQSQNVIITDLTDPVPDAASLPDIMAICEVVEADMSMPTASDNCMGTITGTPDVSFPISTAGTTVITWTFTDAGGNTATQTQNVIIEESPIANVSLADANFTYDGTEHSLSVAGLPAGASVTYQNNAQVNAGTYQVTATVDPGVSSCPEVQLTATMTIDKAPQIITFDEIPVMHLEEDGDFSLTATASSGLEVTYSYTYTAATAPATVSAAGDVSLLTSGVVEITASQAGNENYLPADPVTRILTIESSDATIHELTINETTYVDPANTIRYVMSCDENMLQVNVSFTKEVGATANVSESFTIATPGTGTFNRTITITSQDGTQTETYQLIIEKPYNYLSYSAVVVEKFNNVLLVNNNPDTNGGYRFVSYKWYKNDALIGTGQYYSAGESAGNTLDPNAMYYVEMTDASGNVYRTCAFKATFESTAFSLDVYPNPASAGTTLEVKTTYSEEMLSYMSLTVSTLFGTPVLKTMTVKNNNQLVLPSSLVSGTYVVTTKAGDVVLSTKIIVK